jgi:hypothetical protein
MVSSVALHEAGHAVAAYKKGLPVFVARLGEDPSVICGRPHELFKRGKLDSQVALAFALFALAGTCADPSKSISADDERLLSHAIFMGSWDDTPAIRNVLREIAQEFVEKHCEAIERVAAALDERQSLTGDEVAKIIGGHFDRE